MTIDSISLMILTQYGYIVRISSTNRSHIEYFQMFYGECVIHDNVQFALSIDISIYDGEYRITLSSGEIAITSYPLFWVHRFIYEKAFVFCKAKAFHGSALSKNGKTIVLIAPTRFGKTTLSCFLSFTGFDLVSEDVVILESDYVKGNMMPFHLRKKGFESLQPYSFDDFHPEEIFDGISSKFVYYPKSRCIVNQKISTVFFTKYSINNFFKPLLTTEKVELLLRNTIIPYSIDSDLMKAINGLSQKNCYRLEYSDFAFALECINKSLELQ